jgi:hypothetical protein
MRSIRRRIVGGGRLRAKREALKAAVVGRLLPHHAFLLAEQLSHLDYLEEAIALLDTIPGISPEAVQVARTFPVTCTVYRMCS